MQCQAGFSDAAGVWTTIGDSVKRSARMKRSPFLLLSGLGMLLSCLATSGLAQSIKPGTEVKVRLLENLNTGETKEGQTFSATLAEPVKLENGKVLTRGAQINGLVTEAVSSGRLKRPASITLTLTS